MHDGLPGLREIGRILHGGGSTDDGQTVERIGVEAVFDALQCFDQRRITDGIADTQSGKGVRFGQRAHYQQIGEAVNQTDSRFATEVDIGLVDHNHRFTVRRDQPFNFIERQHAPGRCIRIGENDASVVAQVIVDPNAEAFIQRNRNMLDTIQSAIHGIETVGDVRH